MEYNLKLCLLYLCMIVYGVVEGYRIRLVQARQFIIQPAFPSSCFCASICIRYSRRQTWSKVLAASFTPLRLTTAMTFLFLSGPSLCSHLGSAHRQVRSVLFICSESPQNGCVGSHINYKNREERAARNSVQASRRIVRKCVGRGVQRRGGVCFRSKLEKTSVRRLR